MLNVRKNGWASVADVVHYLRLVLAKQRTDSAKQREINNYLCSVNWLFSITLADKKKRYQLACLTDNNGQSASGTHLTSIEFIRVASGHSRCFVENMDTDASYVALGPKFVDYISCLCHKTKKENILSIFYDGLLPGGTAGNRGHSNLSPFLPHDPRNRAAGRAADSYDTVIMYDMSFLLTDGIELSMSMNGIVATRQILGSSHINLVYVVPGGNYDERWVLYDPALWTLIPAGFTMPPNASSRGQLYYEGAASTRERMAKKDSYTCPNPACRCFNPRGFTACVTCGCKYTFNRVIVPSKAAIPSDDDNVEGDNPTPQEIVDYGLRVAAFALRNAAKRIHVHTDDSLLWTHILRCLDWRHKWDHIWDQDDNFRKIALGGSRWHAGRHWDKPSKSTCDRMVDTPSMHNGPGYDRFVLWNQECFENPLNENHSYVGVILAAGYICDALEQEIPHLVRNFQKWKQNGQTNPTVMKVYRTSLPHCLAACNCSFPQLTVSLRNRVEQGGADKLRHAMWLDSQMNGEELTAEQMAEIRYATMKYRPHKAKYNESRAKQTAPTVSSTTQPHTATIAEGAGSSSSGIARGPFPQRTHSVPQRNPAPLYDGQPPTPFVLPQGPVPVGRPKRVRDDRSISRTTRQPVDDPFVAMVQQARNPQAPAPCFVPNPYRDIRLDAQARSPSPARAPTVDHPSVKPTDKQLWADMRLAAAARTCTPSKVVYANTVVVPQGDAVWSHLDHGWVHPSGTSSRITRSRSPPRRPRQLPDARHPGSSRIQRSPSPMQAPPGMWEPCD